MPPRIIKIVGADACGNLKIENDGNTKANAGETIIWQITTPSVKAIQNITAKSGSDDIWATRPSQQGADRHWEGVITTPLGAESLYMYSITWTDGSSSFTYDPLIYIKPGGGNQYQFYSLTTVVFFIILLFTTVSTWFIAQKKARKN